MTSHLKGDMFSSGSLFSAVMLSLYFHFLLLVNFFQKRKSHSSSLRKMTISEPYFEWPSAKNAEASICFSGLSAKNSKNHPCAKSTRFPSLLISPFISLASDWPTGCERAGTDAARCFVRGRRFVPGTWGWHPRPTAHEAGHRPAAAEDPQAHWADQDRADGQGRQRRRVPQTGQQCRQAAELAH